MWPCLSVMKSWTGEAQALVANGPLPHPLHSTPPRITFLVPPHLAPIDSTLLCRLEGLTELHLDSAHWPAGAPPTAPPTLCRLSAKLNRGTQGHYIAAHEFCKISGLLCSYGNLVQEVRDNILCTFCRGPASSFSVQVVVKDSEGSRESGWGVVRSWWG